MSDKVEDISSMDYAWWEPPLFEMDNDHQVLLYTLVREFIFSGSLEDNFYPDVVPKKIMKRAKQFECVELYSYSSECFVGDELIILTDKRNKQSVLINGSWQLGNHFKVANLPDRRTNTLWPYIEEFLFGGTICDYFIEFTESGTITKTKFEPWNLSFLLVDFWFGGNGQLKAKFKKAIEGIYRIAPDDCLLKEIFPTAERWFRDQRPYG